MDAQLQRLVINLRACDTWTRVAEHVTAIHALVHARRAIDQIAQRAADDLAALQRRVPHG